MLTEDVYSLAVPEVRRSRGAAEATEAARATVTAKSLNMMM